MQYFDKLFRSRVHIDKMGKQQSRITPLTALRSMSPKEGHPHAHISDMCPIHEQYKHEIIKFIREMSPQDCKHFWASMGYSNILEYIKPLNITEADLKPKMSKEEKNRKLRLIFNKFKKMNSQNVDLEKYFKYAKK